MEKTYGKQKVYAINQDLVSSPAGDLNITEIDAKISELTRQNAEDETFIKKAESELKILNSTLSIAEATSQLKMVFSFLFCILIMFLEVNLSLFCSCVKKMKQWNQR